MKFRVVFSPEARADLLELYDYIADRAGESRALAFVASIERHCLGFTNFPERGTRRDDIRPGLRTVGFKRRATIAFHVDEGMVVFDRILYGGRDVEGALH